MLQTFPAQAEATDAVQDSGPTLLDKIEVTGSRIKRADAEGALPVTVSDRQDIEVSGKTTGPYLPDNLYVVRNSDGSVQSVHAGYGNQGLVKTDGIDLNLRTRFDLGAWGRPAPALHGTWTHSYTLESDDGSTEYIGSDGYPE